MDASARPNPLLRWKDLEDGEVDTLDGGEGQLLRHRRGRRLRQELALCGDSGRLCPRQLTWRRHTLLAGALLIAQEVHVAPPTRRNRYRRHLLDEMIKEKEWCH
jgi:hypothetical protein